MFPRRLSSAGTAEGSDDDPLADDDVGGFGNDPVAVDAPSVVEVPEGLKLSRNRIPSSML